MSWASVARCSSSFKREQTWNVCLVYKSLSGKCLFQNNSNINLFQQSHRLTTISSSIVFFFKHTISRKCEHKQRCELREDRVINKYYNWWWIGGIQSFLRCEHPVCSPLCVHTRSREAPANRWYAQGMSGMQVHECLHNSSRSGLLTHCPVKKMKVSQSKRATNLCLSGVAVQVLSWTL